MNPNEQSVSRQVRSVIEETIRTDMGIFGFHACNVEPGEDHDGDPVIHIVVEYDPEGPPVDPEVLAGLVTKVRDRLWALGETRFPHIHHKFPENQKVVGYSA